MTSALRPPLGSVDSFQDRKWKEYIARGVADLEDAKLPGTVTAAGTTGNQTINKPCGTVNFAAAAVTLVVTNSLVTANSIVFATVLTNDSTALIKNVVPAAGSFTIRLNAAATAETRVGFLVVTAFG
jgi:hypothetical protein